MIRHALAKEGGINSIDWDKVDVPQVALMRTFGQYIIESHERGLPKLPHAYRASISKILDPINVLSVGFNEVTKEYIELVTYGLDNGCLWHVNVKNGQKFKKDTGMTPEAATNVYVQHTNGGGGKQCCGDSAVDFGDEESVKKTGSSYAESPLTSPTRSPEKIDASTSPYSRSCSPKKSEDRGSTSEESVNNSTLDSSARNTTSSASSASLVSSVSLERRPSIGPIRSPKNTEARTAPYSRSCSPKEQIDSGVSKVESGEGLNSYPRSETKVRLNKSDKKSDKKKKKGKSGKKSSRGQLAMLIQEDLDWME